MSLSKIFSFLKKRSLTRAQKVGQLNEADVAKYLRLQLIFFEKANSKMELMEVSIAHRIFTKDMSQGRLKQMQRIKEVLKEGTTSLNKYILHVSSRKDSNHQSSRH